MDIFTVYQQFFVTLLFEVEILFVGLLCWLIWNDALMLSIAVYEEGTTKNEW